MLGLLLWTVATVGLLVMGTYSVRNPERRPLGMSIGAQPSAQRMRLMGRVLVSLGVVAVLFEVWMVVEFLGRQG